MSSEEISPLRYQLEKIILTDKKGETIEPGQWSFEEGTEEGTDNGLNDLKDIKKSYFPKDIQLCLLADLTYKLNENSNNNHIIGNCGEEWTLVAKGCNAKDGYFGTAFWHQQNKHLVICHRGTVFGKSYWADYKGVFKNEITGQMHSACTFTFFVVTKFQNIQCSLSITGHSLGGWLAQITTFALAYLKIENTELIPVSNDLCEQCHPHTVVFDSPGCYPMLTTLAETYYQRYGRPRADQSMLDFDVLTYFIRPNRINCFNKHIGTLVIFESLSRLQQINDSESANDTEIQSQSNGVTSYFTSIWEYIKRKITPFTLKYHRLENFKKLLKENYENISEDENDENYENMSEVLNWPLNETRSTRSNCVNEGGLEYRNYFENTNRNNEYLVNVKKIEELNSKYITINYVPREFNENVKYSKTFSKKEFEFLEKLYDCRHQSLDLSQINTYLTEKTNCSLEHFPSFTISNKKVSGSEFEKLVNHTKWLLTYFPDIQERLPQGSLSYENVYKSGTSAYLNTITSYCVGEKEIIFKDNIKLEEFLNDTRPNGVMILKTKQQEDEVFKINTILKSLGILTDRTFLSWSQIVNLSEIQIDPAKVFASPSNVDKILVIDYRNQEHINILLNKIHTRGNDSRKKIICIASEGIKLKNRQINCRLKLVDNKFLVENSTFSDLSVESQNLVVQKKLILFRGKRFALNDEIWNIPNWTVSLEQLPFKAIKEYFLNSNKQIDISFKNDHFKKVLFNLSWVQVETKIKIDTFIRSLSNFHLGLNPNIQGSSNFEILITGFKKNGTKRLRNLYDLKHLAKSDKRLILHDESEPKKCDEIFRYLCQWGKTILWVHYENEFFIFRQIFNPDFYIQRTFIEENTSYEEPINENDLLMNRGERVTIISGDPGTGKSTAMLSLAETLENSKEMPKSWIIWICLSKAETRDKIPSEINMESVVNFLLQFAGDSSELSQVLLKCFLTRNNTIRIDLFFDSFDEICIHESNQQMGGVQQNILGLLKFLKNETNARIWISTRSYGSPILIQELEIESTLKLQKISKAEQEEFLRKFWLSKMSLFASEHDIEIIENFLNRFMIRWNEKENNDSATFLEVLLQLRMVGELFQSEKPGNLSSFDFRLCTLYKKYIDRKFELFFSQNESFGNTETSRNIIKSHYMKIHGVFAMTRSFGNNGDIENNLGTIELRVEADRRAMNQIGLVQINFGENEYNIIGYKFVHSTFIDYFSSHWLVEKMKSAPKGDFAKFVFQTVFIKPHFKLMRSFINGILEEEQSPKQANILSHYPNFFLKSGNAEGLHKLAEEGNFKIIKTILNSFDETDPLLSQLLNTKDQFGRTALHIAIQFGYTDIAKHLLTFNALIDISDQANCLDLAAEKVGLNRILPDKIKEISKLGGIELNRFDLDEWVAAEERNWTLFFEMLNIFYIYNYPNTEWAQLHNPGFQFNSYNLMLILIELRKIENFQNPDQYNEIISILECKLSSLQKFFLKE